MALVATSVAQPAVTVDARPVSHVQDLPDHGFSDVPPWVGDAVRWLAAHDLVSGFGDGTFRPDEPVSRAQVARTLYRAAGSPSVQDLPPHGFGDVPAWIEDSVRWLSGHGHVEGFADATFRPDEPVSRAQVARMLYRVAGSPSVAALPDHGFGDVPVWAENAVRWLSSHGFAEGFGDGTFRPDDPVSRAQIARMLYRIHLAAPVLTSIGPSSGTTRGGTRVQIVGTGLAEATAVTFGAEPALSFTVDSDERVTAVSPAHPIGHVDVSVVTSTGVSAETEAGRFGYEQSAAMGSPDASLGNDPERWDDEAYQRPFYWLNIAGRANSKANGDRFAAGLCGGSFSGCSGLTNAEFSENGYGFRLEVDPAGSDDLRVQAFDPAWAGTGSRCSSNLIERTDTSKIDTLVAQGHPDAGTRLVAGNSRWCTGDDNAAADDEVLNTTFVVRSPDDTPSDDRDNPIVCATTFDGYDEDTWPLLNQTDGYKDGPIGRENMAFDDHFRQWADVCTVPAASVEPGEYLVQVTTTADLTSPPTSLADHDPSVVTHGYNRYSLRAGFATPNTPGFTTGADLSADGHLPMSVNQSVGGTPTNVRLAEVTSDDAGRSLEVELFDVADGADASLTIVPPPGMTGGPPADCTFLRDADPPEIMASEGCTLSGLNSAFYNGRVVSVEVPIPADYDCNPESESGCWFAVHLDFNGGVPSDVTTWSARLTDGR